MNIVVFIIFKFSLRSYYYRSLAGKIYDSYYSAGSKITEDEVYMRSYYNVYLKVVVDYLENPVVSVVQQPSAPEFLIDWLPVMLPVL
jgi:hypothetical protein